MDVLVKPGKHLWLLSLLSLLCVAAGLPGALAQQTTPSDSPGGPSGSTRPGSGARSAFGTSPAPSPAPAALPGDSAATLPAGSTTGSGSSAPGSAAPADATLSGPVKPLDSGPTTFSI